MIHGTLAAAVTPLRGEGRSLDLDAVPEIVRFLATGGVDGILALGTAGEGILFNTDERRRVAEAFIDAAAGSIDVAVHCGAQTTATTTGLAAHAAEAGATAVAVIAPPYFPLDEREQFAHLAAAANACAPLPFYVYEFAARSGYAVALDVLARLRDTASNFRGLKISDAPFERFRPYVLDGLDIFVGPEALISDGLAAGAVGAVSALASAFPEQVVAAVRERSQESTQIVAELRAAVQTYPMPAALKAVLRRQGVALEEDVRGPLRTLDDVERSALFTAIDRLEEVHGATVD